MVKQKNNILRSRCASIAQRYGRFLPENEKVKYYTFTEILKKHFSLNNPIVKQDIKFIQENYDLIWERRNNFVTLTRIS